MPPDPLTLYGRIKAFFPYPLTPQQDRAAMRLAAFACSAEKNPAFILRGYAGTGKTTLVGAFVQALRGQGAGVVLLAPTGRAAKVLAAHAGGDAYTVHKAIYRQRQAAVDNPRFELGFNRARATIFVVDEASMISRTRSYDTGFGTGSLLDDLVSFVYSSPCCRLLLIGDEAQLPPVGEADSPALRKEVLSAYSLSVADASLTEVVRQHAASDVLAAATLVRRQLQTDAAAFPPLAVSSRGEMRYLPGGELVEQLISDYAEHGVDETLVVTTSNKRANLYNQGIRARVFDHGELPARGDLVMVVKNNYYWAARLAKTQPPSGRPPFDFIANGDRAEVAALRNVHRQHGFLFADATLRFPDYGGYALDCRVLLSTLLSESPALTREESRLLHERVLADYADVPHRRERLARMREDPYYNALQLKYAYAVTCHKAQGGQWACVYIDQGGLSPDAPPAERLRWLYTALTRTTARAYLVNWPQPQLVCSGEEG